MTIRTTPHDDSEQRSKVKASGVWGTTTTTERDAVSHLPLEEAVEVLEADLPERVAGHVRAFYAEGHSSRGSGAPKVRRILRILTTEAARVAANGPRKAQEPVSTLA
jgi:hypothetical protein